MQSTGPTPWRELFVFSHARESGSPAGTGQNASWGNEGARGLFSQHRLSNQSKQTYPGAEHSTAQKPRGPGSSLLLVSYSARVPGGTCHRWPPGLRLHPYSLRMMGKGAMRPLAPKQPKGKGKRHTGHLPGKGGSKVLKSLIAAPSGSPSPRPKLSQGAKSSGPGRR